jgi:hypothetical protein
MNIRWTHTERGFARGDFADLYGQKCSLQRSSIATTDAVWCGVDVSLRGDEVNSRMHLDREQARVLAAHLQRFADEGVLPGEAEADNPEEGDIK